MSWRIYLSPPDAGERERQLLLDAFDSNWIAPTGPHVDAFEEELAGRVDTRHAVALSSGTAGLHLGLLLAGVGPGDEVVCSSLTFAASANAIRYCGADPVFVDSEPERWTLDPELLDSELSRLADRDRLPAAILTVDLYGTCCDYTAIAGLTDRYGIPLIEDAAEALGAQHDGRPAGSFGLAGVLSFNGNKVITSGGGGALVTDDAALADAARQLSTQAREPAPHYEHRRVGFNYRLSNLLAAVGRGQLESLDDKVARRREINVAYRQRLGDLPGVTVHPTHEGSICWLTSILVDPDLSGTDREAVRTRLAAEGIEARPVWKPMHLQPIYAHCRSVGGAVAERLFRTGLCLPSGSSLSDDDVEEITGLVRSVVAGSTRASGA